MTDLDDYLLWTRTDCLDNPSCGQDDDGDGDETMSETMLRFVFVDIETGGLSPERDAVTQIGAVAFTIDGDSNYHFEDRFSAVVEPSPRVAVCMKALEVQGVRSWQEFAKRQEEAVSEHDAYTAFMDFLGENLPCGHDDGYHPRIWAHNAEFDYAFLRNLALRVPGTAGVFPYRPSWNCTKYMYRSCVAIGLMPDKGSTSLDTLCAEFGIERPETHDALADARAGAQCLAKMMCLLRNRE
jgi:DNA polymerase III subunit epsilon